MDLAEAVQEAVVIITEGREAELPMGEPYDCFRCPLAKFLSDRTGKKVVVGEEYIGTLSDSAERTPFIRTPPELVVWITNFDKRARQWP